ncbi:MAG TPA: hypothetical protein VGN64_23430 [Dyadobacter sp.]|jgi:hypothetical protein|nr:hypothetical protein [Dyadobacter sp.]
MGSQIAPVVKPGVNIAVSGVMQTNPFGTREVRLVSLDAAGKTISEASPTAPASLPEEKILTGTGKITGLQADRAGNTNGLFLDDKILLRLPPHVAAQLGTALSKGAAISYSGSQRSKKQ